MRKNATNTATILFAFTLITLLIVTFQLKNAYSQTNVYSNTVIINYFEEERNETIIQSFWKGAIVSIEYTFNGSLSLGVERMTIRGEVILERFVNNTELEKKRIHDELSFKSREQGEIHLQFIFQPPIINESDPLSTLLLMKKAALSYSITVHEDPISFIDIFVIIMLGTVLIAVINRFIYVIERKERQKKKIFDVGREERHVLIGRLQRPMSEEGKRVWDSYFLYFFPEGLILGATISVLLVIMFYLLTYPKLPVHENVFLLSLIPIPLKESYLQITFIGIFGVLGIFGYSYNSREFMHFWSYKGFKRKLFFHEIIMNLILVALINIVSFLVYFGVLSVFFFGEFYLNEVIVFGLGVVQVMGVSLIMLQIARIIRVFLKSSSLASLVFISLEYVLEFVFPVWGLSLHHVFLQWKTTPMFLVTYGLQVIGIVILALINYYALKYFRGDMK